MKILPTALLLASALALAAPASANVSMNEGKKLCKAELRKQTPAPKDIFPVMRKSYANEAFLKLAYTLQWETGAPTHVVCTIDRKTEVVQIASVS